MLGALFLNKEIQEIEYLIKRELEELLLDIEDTGLNNIIRRAMEERYQFLFRILKRFAPQDECIKYIRPKRKSL